MANERKIMIQVLLDKEAHEFLKQESNKTMVPMTAMIRKAVDMAYGNSIAAFTLASASKKK